MKIRKIVANWFARHWVASAFTSMVALAVLGTVEIVIRTMPKIHGCIIAMVTGNGTWC